MPNSPEDQAIINRYLSPTVEFTPEELRMLTRAQQQYTVNLATAPTAPYRTSGERATAYHLDRAIPKPHSEEKPYPCFKLGMKNVLDKLNK